MTVNLSEAERADMVSNLAHSAAKAAEDAARQKLTSKQLGYLRALSAYIADHGYPPTFKELGEALGRHGNAASEALEMLVTKGAITRVRGQSRSARITEAGVKALETKS